MSAFLTSCILFVLLHCYPKSFTVCAHVGSTMHDERRKIMSNSLSKMWFPFSR